MAQNSFGHLLPQQAAPQASNDIVIGVDPYKGRDEARKDTASALDAQRAAIAAQNLAIDQKKLAIDLKKTQKEQSDKATKFENARTSAVQSMRNVMDTIDKISLDTAEANGWWQTGKSGALVRSMPDVVAAGTDAYNLDRSLRTIDANTAFSALNEMRQNSPTGGALGSVTAPEMDLLKSTIASLDPNQSQEQFLANLATAKKTYLEKLRAIDPEAADEYSKKPGIRFDEKGNPTLVFTQGEDTREKRDPFGFLPQGGGPDGGGGAPPPPNGGLDPNIYNPEGGQGIIDLAKQGITFGLADEAAGAGGYLGALITGNDPSKAYTRERDAARENVRRARIAHPVVGTLAEFMGGGAGVKAVQGAASLGTIVKQGAGLAALGGFGYGEGDQSLTTAAGGAVLGGALGGAFGGVSKFIEGRAARSALAPEQVNVIEAGQRQGIPMRQPDVRPELRNKLAQVETTGAGGPIVQQARAGDAAAIESRVSALGGQGSAADPYALGTKIQDAGRNYIARTKAQAGRMYDKARELAGGGDLSDAEIAAIDVADSFGGGFADIYGKGGIKAVEALEKKGFIEITSMKPGPNGPEGYYFTLTDKGKAAKSGGAAVGATVQPKEALAALDAQIADLRATGENANAEAIRYLDDVRADLAKEGGVTIDAIRNIRTNMRGQISQRGLTGTDTDRRVMAAIDGANLDMARDLPPEAAQAFKAADAFYKERQDFISKTLKAVMGDRNNPLPPETAAARLTSMTQGKGNFERFSSMWKELSPEDQADTAATIAETLGRKANGDFSVPALIKSLDPKKGINPRTARLIFGEDGAKALDDLRAIASAKDETQRALNNSRTGTAVNAAGDSLRTLMWGLFGFTQGGPVGAAGGAAARGFFSSLSEKRAARMLMNPDFTKLLRNAPNTNDPATINRYFSRVAGVLGANDNEALTGAIATAFRQSPGAAAANEETDSRGEPPQQNGM